MKVCFLDEILVKDDRIRKEIKPADIKLLAEDIAKNGLYHPIVLMLSMGALTHNETSQNDKLFILVAGERRFRAIQLLAKEKRRFTCDFDIIEPGCCPYVLLGDLSPHDILEVELHENLMRNDLSWQEIVTTRNRLHELRSGDAKDAGEDWSMKETAKELSEMSGSALKSAEHAIARATSIAPHLEDKDLKNARSEKEAYRILQRKLEGEFLAALDALDANKDGTVSSVVDNSSRLIQGDFRDVEIPENYFDLVIADPPYGISAQNFGNAAKMRHAYNDSKEIALEISKAIIYNSVVWTKEEAHLFLFCDAELFLTLREYLYHNTSWIPFRTPLFWYHATAGHIPWGVNSFRREYDMILYAKKEDSELNQLHADVFNINKERTTEAATHGARKPISLYREIMKIACPVVDGKVIDPCCGSGPVFPAAKAVRAEAWGIELDPEIYKMARVEFEGE